MKLNKHPKIEEYINNVCSQIKNKKAHEEIKMELLGHIEELVLEYVAMDIKEDQAVEKAIKNMGDAEIVGNQLNMVHKSQPEWGILAISILFACLGLIAIYFIQNLGATLIPLQIFNKSLFIVILGTTIMLGLYFIDYRKIQPFSRYIYISTLLLLLLLPMVFDAKLINSRGWFVAGPISISFVEVGVFLLIIALAGMLDGWNWNDTKRTIIGLALSIAPILIIFKASSSFSDGVIYLIASITIMIISGLKVKHILLALGFGVGTVLLLITTQPHRLARFSAFLNPSQDAQGGGWVYIQISKIIHSAGLFGQGFTFTPHMLPSIYTDYIFTYIIYTFGWIAGIIIAGLALIFLKRLVHVAVVSKNSFGKLLASGITAVFIIQFAWNILMNLSLVPITSIGLPFISYGGSQFIINMAELGIIINIYKYKTVSKICIED